MSTYRGTFSTRARGYGSLLSPCSETVLPITSLLSFESSMTLRFVKDIMIALALKNDSLGSRDEQLLDNVVRETKHGD